MVVGVCFGAWFVGVTVMIWVILAVAIVVFALIVLDIVMV